MTDWREKFASEMGLPLSARFQHAEDEVREAASQVRSQHPDHTPDMARGRALARLDARKHQRSQAKSFIVTKDHNWRRKVEVAVFILMFLFCLVMATRAHGQSTTIQGRAKGATAANTATVTSVDANHNAIDVNIASGGGSGGTASNFGAAFPATGTAAGFSDGVNMLPATLDASGFLKINCAAGCVAGGSFTDSSAFTFGTTSVGNMSAVVDDVATNTVAENSAGAVRMNANRILYMDISKTAANTIAIKVDGSAVTQPISGSISFTAPQHVIVDSGSTGVTNLPTTVDTNSGVKSASTLRVVLATDQPALTNKLLVTPDSVALPANQSVNVSQINAVTPLMGNGVTGTGSQRVTIASDNTAFPVNAASTLAAETTKVIGTVRTADGAGNLLTTNSTTYTAKFALDGNLLGTLGTAFTTAGKVDVKGADGDVFVRQATAANLKMDLSGSAANATAGLFSVKIDQTTPGTTNGVSSVGTLADNGAAAATNRVGVLPGVVQTSYNNGTASTQGRNAALNIGTDGLAWVAALPAIRPASYTASASIAASSTTDNCRMPGNASNTVLVTMVKVSGTQTTAGAVTVTVNKRSTAGSGGTAANITVVPDDSNYAAGVSVPQSYTGTGPTVGTLVGAIDNMKVGFLATTTASPQDIYILNLRQKPIVLRGTAENLTVNLGGAVTGGNMTCTFNWIETATITP